VRISVPDIQEWAVIFKLQETFICQIHLTFVEEGTRPTLTYAGIVNFPELSSKLPRLHG